jgi:hypothetical protein
LVRAPPPTRKLLLVNGPPPPMIGLPAAADEKAPPPDEVKVTLGPAAAEPVVDAAGLMRRETEDVSDRRWCGTLGRMSIVAARGYVRRRRRGEVGEPEGGGASWSVPVKRRCRKLGQHSVKTCA